MTFEGRSGVYSTKGSSWIGSGTTKRKVVSRRYWFCFEMPGGGAWKVQPLTSNLVPVGTPRQVEAQEFAASYKHEPDFYVDPNRIISLMPEGDRPQAVSLPAQVAGAVRDSDAERHINAEAQAAMRLREVERLENEARADFGMGLTFFRAGNTRKAMEIFSSIAEREVAWQPEHKHMFCEFGTGLRKTRLLDVALKHYFKALEMAPEDEHLHHNIARVYYEQNKYDNCRQWLEKSLEINPELTPSQQFLSFLRKTGKLPSPRV